jgi:KDO2-lipid IV(A) lauroyltransferase
MILFKAVSFIFARLPLSVALAAGRGIGWIFNHLVRQHRASMFEALQRAFPDQTPAQLRSIVNRMYAGLGQDLVESLRYSSPKRVTELNHKVEWENRERLDQALAEGRGAIILTAHFGNFDLMSTAAARCGYTITMITKKIKNSAIDRAWKESRTALGLRFVPARHSYRECLRTLRRNEIVGFVLDQNMVRDEGVFVDYFGRLASTTPGLAVMAAQTGAPVLPIFIYRLGGGRHRIKVLPRAPQPAGREPAQLRAATQQYTRIIEQVVRETPDHWIWMHRRWRTQPNPGTPPDQQDRFTIRNEKR